MFTYSERANTQALEMDGVVSLKDRQKRSKMLRALSEKKKRYFYEQHVDQMQTVLFEDDVEDGHMHGFTENYIRNKAKYDPVLINEMKVVKMARVDARGLMEVEEVEEILAH